jgi:signal transduction histidine kinase
LSRYKIELRKKTFNPETINSDQHIIDNTIEGLRAISMDLIPSYLLKNGLLDAIEDYINQFKKNNLMNTKLNISVSSEKIKLYSLNQQLNIYRIWLEVFHNICKHTNCNRIEINLKCEDDFLKITFEHNGKGISNKEIKALTESTDGIGLKSIKARSLLLNAAINYHHNDSKPLVEINFPIKQNKLVNN